MMSWRPVWWIASIASAALWAGCTTAHIGEGRGQVTNVAGSEAVTVLLNYMGLEGRTVEEEIVGCIRAVIRKVHPELRVIPADEFRRIAFPDLAPEAAPRSPQYLGMLLDNAVFRERIAPLNIRYLVAIGGDTRVETAGGAVAQPLPYSVSPSGGVFFGAWVWDRKTRLIATILDLKQSREATEVSASAEGTAWLVVIQGLPLGAPAFTETNACAALGDKVARFLATAPRDQ